VRPSVTRSATTSPMGARELEAVAGAGAHHDHLRMAGMAVDGGSAWSGVFVYRHTRASRTAPRPREGSGRAARDVRLVLRRRVAAHALGVGGLPRRGGWPPSRRRRNRERCRTAGRRRLRTARSAGSARSGFASRRGANQNHLALDGHRAAPERERAPRPRGQHAVRRDQGPVVLVTADAAAVGGQPVISLVAAGLRPARGPPPAPPAAQASGKPPTPSACAATPTPEDEADVRAPALPLPSLGRGGGPGGPRVPVHEHARPALPHRPPSRPCAGDRGEPCSGHGFKFASAIGEVVGRSGHRRPHAVRPRTVRAVAVRAASKAGEVRSSRSRGGRLTSSFALDRRRGPIGDEARRRVLLRIDCGAGSAGRCFSTVAGPRIAYAWTWWNSREIRLRTPLPAARDEGAPATIALPHRTSHPSRYVSRKRRWCADVLVIRLATDRRA